jgi:hypothetical protein
MSRDYTIPENKEFEILVGDVVKDHLGFETATPSGDFDHWDTEYVKDGELYRSENKDRDESCRDWAVLDGAYFPLKKWEKVMEDITQGIGWYCTYTFNENINEVFIYKFLDSTDFKLRANTGRTRQTRCPLDVQHYVLLPWDKFIKIGEPNA